MNQKPLTEKDVIIKSYNWNKSQWNESSFPNF
jgi:hypothetical protein